jgi:hypothetical protein
MHNDIIQLRREVKNKVGTFDAGRREVHPFGPSHSGEDGEPSVRRVSRSLSSLQTPSLQTPE